MANSAGDPCRRACLESIRDLAVLNPRIVILARGLQCLIDNMLDIVNIDIVDSLVDAVMYMYNTEETRQYFRPGADLAQLMAPFVDHLAPEGPESANRRKMCARVVIALMRTWPGLLWLCSDTQGMSALLNTLAAPMSEEKRLPLFQTVVDIFRIADPYFGSTLHHEVCANFFVIFFVAA